MYYSINYELLHVEASLIHYPEKCNLTRSQRWTGPTLLALGTFPLSSRGTRSRSRILLPRSIWAPILILNSRSCSWVSISTWSWCRIKVSSSMISLTRLNREVSRLTNNRFQWGRQSWSARRISMAASCVSSRSIWGFRTLTYDLGKIPRLELLRFCPKYHSGTKSREWERIYWWNATTRSKTFNKFLLTFAFLGDGNHVAQNKW